MKWTPISEKLPSERGEYLITWGDIGDGVVDLAYYGKPQNPTREVDGLCFFDYNDEYGDVPYDTVKAWMPLPRPYTADRKTENSSEKPNNCKDEPQTERRE